ncbi:FAD-binding oxidoreductase [Mesorhizobium sp. M7A.F.Ca.US.006.01.1.1]|uniref:NAD(P)/FAD-dependent oxidoreductase n=1 Tax=Mesorhizobium sp. M7A.F.Ca.US.006.01.1.1 TaxID=2496707 RepID=UPI000FCA48E1|nr:FAD-binding oxidoreductase [Mesorhizobium sp. M7A.F.Ca.US.006.01.1.1]RUZ74218.1 FAD-binding oxidoreductase [Mesorhizobium sp. M7A.F.Ca.US.006.01.1.1]
MPGPFVIPVRGDEDFPAEVDVVVVGAGIVGASTALELAEAGLRVALSDKGGVGQEQSSRNLGWIRMTQRDPREIPLMAESLRIWANLDRRTGRDTGFNQCGLVFIESSEKKLTRHLQWYKNLEGYQLTSQVLSPSQLTDLIGPHGVENAGAFYSPYDCRAEPQKATSAIAEAARKKGAFVLTECAVRGFETTNGKITAAITERGTIKCRSLVVAAGGWTNLFLRRHNIDLPQVNVRSTLLRTYPVAGAPNQNLNTDEFGWRKRDDGGYSIGGGLWRTDLVPNSFRYLTRFLPFTTTRAVNLSFGATFFKEMMTSKNWSMDDKSPFEYERVADPTPVSGTDELLVKVAKRFPAFANARIKQRWAGYVDFTPDAVPTLSAIDQVSGLHVATGMSAHGFGIGPGAGRLMADLVTGRTPIVDPTPFRFSRFADGTPMRPIKTL